jgi:hypothetical protein
VAAPMRPYPVEGRIRDVGEMGFWVWASLTDCHESSSSKDQIAYEISRAPSSPGHYWRTEQTWTEERRHLLVSFG